MSHRFWLHFETLLGIYDIYNIYTYICIYGFYLLNEIWETNNDSRKRFVDIGLENVAVAAAHVAELPPRCSNKGGQKRRCF